MNQKFVIDRKKWLRGCIYGVLLNEKGQQCCVGIYLSSLRGQSRAGQIEIHIPSMASWTVDYEITDALYGANDEANIGEAEREEKITRLFLEAGVEVEFR